jgi:hypothetical protein
MAKLDIKRVLTAVDTKDYDFYSNLTEEDRKEFSPYVLMRFTSNVQNDADLQEWFIERTNEWVNKDFFSLGSKHKELQWKLYAATGTGDKFFHKYLAAGKKEKVNKIEKLLAELYPSMKMSDIKHMASMMTPTDCQELFDEMGFDSKQRKEYE